MMHMTFYWGYEATILFDQWKTKTLSGYAFSLAVLFLLSLLQSFLVSRREALAVSRWIKPDAKPSTVGLNEPLLLLEQQRQGCRNCILRVTETLLFFVHAGLGYLLMLAVMSFNGGIFIAVILGLTLGYLFFPISQSEKPSSSAFSSSCACA